MASKACGVCGAFPEFIGVPMMLPTGIMWFCSQAHRDHAYDFAEAFEAAERVEFQRVEDLSAEDVTTLLRAFRRAVGLIEHEDVVVER